jgi:hypothetical protein
LSFRSCAITVKTCDAWQTTWHTTYDPVWRAQNTHNMQTTHNMQHTTHCRHGGTVALLASMENDIASPSVPTDGHGGRPSRLAHLPWQRTTAHCTPL